jgi:serine/threonine protein kinase
MTDPNDHAEARLFGFPTPADANYSGGREDLDVIVSRFADEVRRGKRPSIERYAHENPALAEQIRELLPLITSLEQWKVEREVDCSKKNLPEEFTFQRLGQYKVIREIGRGGMGVVFEAAEERSPHSVAVKVLPWRFLSDTPRRKERFQNEAMMIARLRHRNIVPVYSFGEQDGYCYYVMQMVKGVSLHWVVQRFRESAEPITADEVLRAGRGERVATDDEGVFSRRSSRDLGRDAWTSFARIGVQIALALEHAHQNKVLHNDVKPANLMLDASGRIVVTDFGAGRRPEGDRPEREDYPPGTLRYMAPERLSGQCDARGDVYSLAATIYELVARAPAFDAADRTQLVEQVVKCQPRNVRRLNRRVPRGLAAIIHKGMAKNPTERYPNAKALATDLVRFVNGERPEAQGPGLMSRFLQWKRGTPKPPPRK